MEWSVCARSPLLYLLIARTSRQTIVTLVAPAALHTNQRAIQRDERRADHCLPALRIAFAHRASVAG